jgi:hypothetical protein
MQQLIRHGADDQPMRIVSQIGSTLKQSSNPKIDFLPTSDLSTSEYQFAAIYDRSNKLIQSSATLNGQVLPIPSGSINAARVRGNNKVTWQPTTSLRFNIYAKSYGDFVVVAGQSLKPSEDRIGFIGIQLGAIWLFVVFLVFVGDEFYLLVKRRKSSIHFV